MQIQLLNMNDILTNISEKFVERDTADDGHVEEGFLGDSGQYHSSTYRPEGGLQQRPRLGHPSVTQTLPRRTPHRQAAGWEPQFDVPTTLQDIQEDPKF